MKKKENFSYDLSLFVSVCLCVSLFLFFFRMLFLRLHTTLYGGDERLYLLRYGGDICLSYLRESFRGQELRLILEKRHILKQIEEIVLHQKRRSGRTARGDAGARKKGKEEKQKEDDGDGESSSPSSSSSSLFSLIDPWCVWNLSDETQDQEITPEEIEQKEDEGREEGDDKALISAVVLLQLSQWLLERRKKNKQGE